MRKAFGLALLSASIITVAGCGDSQQASPKPAAAVQAEGLAPMHFATVDAMIEDFGDYSAENGSFVLESSEPLKVQFAPTVVPGDLPENIEREVRRAALYGVFRTLIHTDAGAVAVTSVPNETTFNPHSTRLLEKPRLTISTTREQALQAVKSLVDAQQLSELVVPERAGTIQLDNWRKDFEALYFKDEGQKALLQALQASGAAVSFNG
ncbi:TPA: hypothetical protein NER77_004519 [Pseudomonas aeruginosa]|nr:hypothetical protein [Pseudomonas aeruginosa]HCE0991927.1 hypothetical protein [Pseudomonas aeruginosa]HCE3944592.1 hypothetical protein [Pseudomonas aeruginosa]